MHALNAFVGWLTDVLIWPLRSRPLLALVVVSLVVSALVLIAFKLLSNQRALMATRRRIAAGLFELRLFQDDPRLMLRASLDLLRAQGRYLRYALVPLIVISLPLSLLLTQLHARFGYDGLRAGQSAMLTVRLKSDVSSSASSASFASSGSAAPSIALEVPSGMRVETPRVWVPSLREAAWRIAADRDGDYDLRVVVNGSLVTKRVHVSGSSTVPALAANAPVRPAAGLWNEWLDPIEPPLPADSPIDAIAVTCPERAFELFGIPLHWLVLFFALTTLFTLLARGRLHIVI